MLCEKPVADTLEGSLEFVSAVRSAESRVLVGHILRHNDSYKRIAAMIKGGAIGKPRVFRMVQNHNAVNWERYRHLLTFCPPIVDCGVHYIDVAQWFTGSKIVQVSGISTNIDADVPEGSYNYGMINAVLDDGTIFNYESGWSKNMMAGNLKEFIGDSGYIKLVLACDRSDGHELGDLLRWYDGKTGEHHIINVKSIYKNMYGQLLELIHMIEDPEYVSSPTIDDVESTMRVAFAADMAVRSNRVLHLDRNTQEVIDGGK